MAISIMELTKATRSLEEVLTLYHSSDHQTLAIKKAFRDACIQRFEYCIELAWKTSMKILGSTTMAAKIFTSIEAFYPECIQLIEILEKQK